MPTRRCCCGPCYTYGPENFVRYDEFDVRTTDASYLEPDWEVCGSWSDWQLNIVGITGQLENTTPGAKIVLKHMVGNPYGILQGHIQLIEDSIYRIHVFHGTLADPCSGENLVVEIEWLNSTDGIIRIMSGSTVLQFDEFTADSDTNFEVCVGDGIIEARTDESLTIRHCFEGSADGYWFALEGDTTGSSVTQWEEIYYSDHWEHNKTCPRCSQHCCFPEYGQVIVGFTITIHGIGEGTDVDCDCAESVSFEVTLHEDQDPCACDLYYYINPVILDEETGVVTGDYVTGPHDCDNARSYPSVRMGDCRINGDIDWLLSFIPDDIGQGEVQFPVTFPAGTAPSAIRSDHLDVFDSGDGESCNYDNAWVSFEPILANGCCSETIEEVGTVVSEKIKELPYKDHSALIEQLRGLRIPEDKGLGDTANRVISESDQPELQIQVRRWLKFYSCRRSDACRLVNRMFRY